MQKIGMWQIDIDSEREENIGKEIQVTYKGQPIQGIVCLRIRLLKLKKDLGGSLLVQDSILKEV